MATKAMVSSTSYRETIPSQPLPVYTLTRFPHTAHSHGLENVYKSFYSFWVKHEKKTVGVTFGPRVGDDVTWAPRGGWAGWGTHNTFDWIRDRLHRSRVRSAAFGIGDAQVFAFTDGIVAWNRLGHYPDLKVLIQKQRQGDVVVSHCAATRERRLPSH